MKKKQRLICSVMALSMGLAVGLLENSLGMAVIASMTTLTATIMVAIVNETTYD